MFTRDKLLRMRRHIQGLTQFSTGNTLASKTFMVLLGALADVPSRELDRETDLALSTLQDYIQRVREIGNR